MSEATKKAAEWWSDPQSEAPGNTVGPGTGRRREYEPPRYRRSGNRLDHSFCRSLAKLCKTN